jgi:hypothetical protein
MNYELFKKSKMYIEIALILLILSIIGCTSVDNFIKEDEYGGRAKNYPINKTQSWETAKTVFRWLGAKDYEIEENRANNFVNWAGVMMVIIEHIDDSNTRVIAVLAPSPCAPMENRPTEKDVHKYFSQAVNMLKSGQPLPAMLKAK